MEDWTRYPELATDLMSRTWQGLELLIERDPDHGFGVLVALVLLLVLVAASRRRAWRHREADVETKIQLLIEASRYEEAADLRMGQGEFQKALSLYLNAGSESKAARCYLSLREPRKAAELYARGGRLAEAAHYFQTAGEWRQAADCLDRLGSERESAELYERAGDLPKAAQILRGLGDAENAARLFERAGLAAEAATALLAAHGKERSVLLRAGELFESASDVRRAAECFAAASEWMHAAELFGEVGDFALSAQAFERGEAFGSAAEAYERAGALPEARANFDRAGDTLNAAQIALRLGNFLDAARGFYQIGSYERAIETLQSVASSSPQSRDAMLLLGRIFLEKGLLDRAKEKLEAIEAEPPTSKADLDVLLLLTDAYERSGDILRAMNLLEQIAAFDENYGDIAERLERLQEKAWGGSAGTMALQGERYELRNEIGRGGMGVVYLAHDRELERPVAVKFLPPDLASKASSVKMFRQEARSAAAMNHPNIVHVYDVAVIAGRPCMVMEFVQGKTARELMRGENPRERRPLSARRVGEIARDICDALAYAHTQQVIHRDVKPGNVIVSDRGQAKLMDFGISKVLEIGAEGLTQAKGTPQYMPPEQILGQEVDGRTDLYALGISMFEIVTGRRPFIGEDVVNQQLHSDIPNPRSIREDVPDALVKIITKACRKNPEDRFRSAREMADALSSFLSSPTSETES